MRDVSICSAESAAGAIDRGAGVKACALAGALSAFGAAFVASLFVSALASLFVSDAFSDFSEDFYVSSPLHFMHQLGGRHLDVLRTRYIHFASGEGKAEAQMFPPAEVAKQVSRVRWWRRPA